MNLKKLIHKKLRLPLEDVEYIYVEEIIQEILSSPHIYQVYSNKNNSNLDLIYFLKGEVESNINERSLSLDVGTYNLLMEDEVFSVLVNELHKELFNKYNN